MITENIINNQAFDIQLDNEADAYFCSYAGVSIERAKAICLENQLDFQDEFWKPFIKDEESKVPSNPNKGGV